MTRRQWGIIALLTREPTTAYTLAIALDERLPDVQVDLDKLDLKGIVERTPGGWRLTKKVAA